MTNFELCLKGWNSPEFSILNVGLPLPRVTQILPRYGLYVWIRVGGIWAKHCPEFAVKILVIKSAAKHEIAVHKEGSNKFNANYLV